MYRITLASGGVRSSDSVARPMYNRSLPTTLSVALRAIWRSVSELFGLLEYSPSFWFFALFNQLNGSLPVELVWLAWRPWIGLGAVVCGAAGSCCSATCAP
jgi:hypothetical protein